MFPFVTEDITEEVLGVVFQDINNWRKEMIHYIKEENPEINAAIIEAANKTSLDPKAVALGAYMAYKLLESAMQRENENLDILE